MRWSYSKVIGGDFDLEWSNDRISIVGLSDGSRTLSVSWDQGRERLEDMARDPNLVWIGHNIIQADWRELLHEGIKMPGDAAHAKDTIIEFWLTNSHLCKTTKKASIEGDEGERKGRGFMNLGTMLSLTTDLQHYKECRRVTHKETTVETYLDKKGREKTRKVKSEIVDNECEGPCPLHDIFGYNGIDSLGPMLSQPQLEWQMRLRGVDKLYPMHVDLARVLSEMTERGCPVDLDYIHNTLQRDFNIAKEAYWNPETESGSLPFNPRSTKAVKAYFKERGIDLDDTQEETIREAVEDNPGDTMLVDLLDYKELGNGADRWFGPRFLPPGANTLHPRFGFFTSTGRLMSSNPNIQNVAARRIDRKTGENVGKKIRRALIAPEGYIWYKADYKQAENRVYLYLAGIEPPQIDFHSWMAGVLNLDAKSPFSLALGGPRDAGKSVVHATDYLEGLQLIYPSAIRDRRIKAEIEAGARIVFPQWKFGDKIVSFTGINLARRALKKATFENRKYVLEAQQKYFAQFPNIRHLQQSITEQCERDSAVIPPHGYYLLSYGRPEDRMKQAAATWGSQPVAHYMKLALIRAEQHPHLIPVFTVHDEIDFFVDARHDKQQVKKWIDEVMVFDTPEMPNFKIPVDVSYGDREKSINKTSNWADQTKY